MNSLWIVAAWLWGVDPATTAQCPTAGLIERFHRERWIRHRVAPRERLDQIAYRYGVSLEKLEQWNELPPEADVATGTVLRIHASRRPPARQRIAYVVAQDDTWWRIAATHGIDSKDLRAYNWPYQEKMKPGEHLALWVDPLLSGWIQSEEPFLPSSESGAVRRGGVGIGRPDDGRLLNGVRIPERPGQEIRFAQTAYGTTFAVAALLAGLETFRSSNDFSGVIKIGSMSAVRGGPIGSHRSHQTGRDVDVRLPRRAGVPRGVPLTVRRIDWIATWFLLEAFDRPDVEVVFLDYPTQKRVYRAAISAGVPPERVRAMLQYPRGSRIASARVHHAYGHDQHMHVRFRCGPCEIECVEASAEP